MSWMVKRIQEDDFGCEERPDDTKTQVLVTLADENGQERLIRVDDEWLYKNVSMREAAGRRLCIEKVLDLNISI